MVTAVLAPMPSELRPFARAVGLTPGTLGDLPVRTGTVGRTEVVATTTGMGTRAAATTAERLLSATDVDRVVVMGIAGGVDATFPIGHVVVPERLIDGTTGAEYRPDPFGDRTPSGALHTSDEFILDEVRLAELRARGVVALDMETAAIARVCEGRCPCSVFRALSDRVTDGLVDDTILGLARPDGSPNLAAAARLLLRRPQEVARLARVARDAAAACTAAARAAEKALRAPVR